LALIAHAPTRLFLSPTFGPFPTHLLPLSSRASPMLVPFSFLGPCPSNPPPFCRQILNFELRSTTTFGFGDLSLGGFYPVNIPPAFCSYFCPVCSFDTAGPVFDLVSPSLYLPMAVGGPTVLYSLLSLVFAGLTILRTPFPTSVPVFFDTFGSFQTTGFGCGAHTTPSLVSVLGHFPPQKTRFRGLSFWNDLAFCHWHSSPSSDTRFVCFCDAIGVCPCSPFTPACCCLAAFTLDPVFSSLGNVSLQNFFFWCIIFADFFTTAHIISRKDVMIFFQLLPALGVLRA